MILRKIQNYFNNLIILDFSNGNAIIFFRRMYIIEIFIFYNNRSFRIVIYYKKIVFIDFRKK